MDNRVTRAEKVVRDLKRKILTGALATGRKTANEMIGVLPDGTRPKTLLEKAEERRMATGLVVTKAVTDATPAAFSAHCASRDDQSAIAAQILSQGIEVILGGGRKQWRPTLQGGARTDGRVLVAEAERLGYRSVTGAQDLAQIQTTPVLGLLAQNSLSEEGDEPSLAAMTGKAIELLSRTPEGFFLLVEGSQIDIQAHKHNAPDMIRRVLLFDAAVKEALAFAARDGHTLVIVTADHETGGLAVLDGLTDPAIDWASFDHSSAPVALFAYGPGAADFTGIYDNTAVAIRIARLLGFTPFPEDHPAAAQP
jgi:alkaline phosphatase